MNLLEDINKIIDRLKNRGDDEDADRIQRLRDKYIRYKAENFARMTQPQPEIHIYLNDDEPTKPHTMDPIPYRAYDCQCIRCIKGDRL